MSTIARDPSSVIFFFQAEDGIRDYKVTGVQTCALPIWPLHRVAIQQKICTPVGMTIIRLAAVKKLVPSCGMPVANMWWTHTLNPMKAVMTRVETMAT